MSRVAAGGRRQPVTALLLLAMAVVAGLGLSAALSGVAGVDSLQARAHRLARQLTCPVCAGQSAADSASPVAVRMRQEILAMLQEGRSGEEILAHYVELYGPWILARPPARGSLAVVWAVPALAGLAVLTVTLGRRGGPPSGSSTKPPAGGRG